MWLRTVVLDCAATRVSVGTFPLKVDVVLSTDFAVAGCRVSLTELRRIGLLRVPAAPGQHTMRLFDDRATVMKMPDQLASFSTALSRKFFPPYLDLIGIFPAIRHIWLQVISRRRIPFVSIVSGSVHTAQLSGLCEDGIMSVTWMSDALTQWRTSSTLQLCAPREVLDFNGEIDAGPSPVLEAAGRVIKCALRLTCGGRRVQQQMGSLEAGRTATSCGGRCQA